MIGDEQVDPISGNEVPLGAKPEEVRDDVDAKLSEGEFVIPANAVRFFGVKFFENLLKKADKGYEEMKSEGRLQSDPDDEMGEEDDLPFDISELEFEDDEAEEQAIDLDPVEMAEGGLVTAGPGFKPPTYNPWDGASATPGSAANPTVESKEFVGPDGKVTTVLYINGMPTSNPPDGYVERGKEESSRAVNEELQMQTSKDNERERDSRGEEKSKQEPVSEWSNEKINKFSGGVGQHVAAGQVVSSVFGALAPGIGGKLVGKATEKSLNKTIDDTLAEIDARVKAGTMSIEQAQENKKALEAQKAKGVGSVDLSLSGLLGKGISKLANTNKGFDADKYVSSYADKYADRQRESGGYLGSEDHKKDLKNTADHYDRAAKGDSNAIGRDYDPYDGDKNGMAKGGLVQKPRKKPAAKPKARKQVAMKKKC